LAAATATTSVAETVPRNSPVAVAPGALAALEVLVAPEASVALEVSVALGVLVVPAVSVVPEAAATDGSTTRNIEVGPRTETEGPRTGLGARRAAIPLATVRPAHGNRLAAKAAIYPVTVAEERARAIAQAAAQALAIERVEAEGTALEIDKFQIPEARRTGAPLVEHLPERVAVQHDPVVRAVRPAWEAPVVVEVPGAAAAGAAAGAGGGRANYDHRGKHETTTL
jgi:hypothetical protein